MLDATRRIVSAVRIPVTADIEAGYGQDIDKVLDVVRKVMALGAVGINIEDSTGVKEHPIFDIPSQVAKIRAIRNIYDLPRATQETLERARAYLDAGADCIFIFGVTDKELLGRLVREISAPVNLLAGPGMPSIAELKQMGVRRLSLGSGAMRATLGTLQQISAELLNQGTYRTLTEGAVPYGTLQQFFTSHL